MRRWSRVCCPIIRFYIVLYTGVYRKIYRMGKIPQPGRARRTQIKKKIEKKFHAKRE